MLDQFFIIFGIVFEGILTYFKDFINWADFNLFVVLFEVIGSQFV